MTLSIIFSAASLILCGFFFVYFQAYLRRKTGPQEILADYREEVNKLIVEIDAATERDAYLVEERIKSLKAILEELDKKIALSVREFEHRRSAETLYDSLGRNAKTAVPPPPPAPPPAETAEKTPSEAPARLPESRPLKEQVAQLASRGFSPGAIAARLKVSISEVELIIAIQDKSR
jgi:uncharacterized membrane protein